MPNPRKYPVPDWISTIERGEILLVGRRRTPRVVREVHHNKSAGKTCITFVIKRCSWTGRCYTVQNMNDLLIAGIERPVPGVRIFSKMKGDLEEKINKTIAAGSRFLDCCDVKGVA